MVFAVKNCYNGNMETSNGFLIASFIVVIIAYFFDSFSDLDKIANAALILAWFSMYTVVRNQEQNDVQLNQIYRRLNKLEGKE